MARKRYARAASALTELSRSKQEATSNRLAAQGIRADTEGKVERMNKAFDLAGQALVTADSLAQEYKTRGKVEKGVTSLAEAKGGDVSYKKTGLGDIFKGEAKLSDWGKETWEIGGSKYDRADVLAWHEKGQKDLKWEGIIGKEISKYDEASGEIKKERVKTAPTAKKDYKIQGEAELFKVEGMEKKYGRGWSYGKEKAMSKMTDVQRAGLPGEAKGILEGQVGVNVESGNFGQIMKAYKSEYGKKQGYDATAVKELELKHQKWRQDNPLIKPDDKPKGVIKSADSAQSQFTSYEDPSGFGTNLTSVQDKEARRKQEKTDANLVAGGKAMYDKISQEPIAGETKLSAEEFKEKHGKQYGDTIAYEEYLQTLGGSGPKKEKGFLPTKDKSFFGKREGFDVWENYKDKRAMSKQAKAKEAIQSLTSGDDYINPNDPDLVAATEFTPEGGSDDESQSQQIQPAQANLSEVDMDSDEDFVSPTGEKLSDYTPPVSQPPPDKSYGGTTTQNINVLEHMMGASMGSLTQEGSMYEGMGVSDIWNQGPLGQKYGKWGSKGAKGQRGSMWDQIQEINYETTNYNTGSYGNK